MGFERLVAGVIVIGLIIFGASILATPDESGEPSDVDPVADIQPGPPDVDVPVDPAPDDEGGDEPAPEPDAEPEQTTSRGKGKKGGDD
jgi:hypothetical protein